MNPAKLSDEVVRKITDEVRNSVGLRDAIAFAGLPVKETMLSMRAYHRSEYRAAKDGIEPQPDAPTPEPQPEKPFAFTVGGKVTLGEDGRTSDYAIVVKQNA